MKNTRKNLRLYLGGKEVSWPANLPKLTTNQLCQGENEAGERKDLLTWLDIFFEGHSDALRHFIRLLCLKEGIFSHFLLNWGDTKSKKYIVNQYNELVDELYGKKKEKGNPVGKVRVERTTKGRRNKNNTGDGTVPTKRKRGRPRKHNVE